MKFQKKNLRWEETNPRKEEKNPRIKVQIQENGFSDSCSSTFLVFFCFFSYNVYSFLKKKYIRGEEKIKVLEKKKTENGKVKNSLGMQSATVGLSGLFFVLFCSIINSILKRVRHSIWIQHWLSTFLMNGVYIHSSDFRIRIRKRKKKFNNKKNKIIIQLFIFWMQCRHDFRFPMQFISLFLSNRNIIVYRPAQQMLQRLFTLFHHHHHLNSIPEKRSLKYTKREYIKSEKCAAWLGIIGLDLISLLHLADVNSS